MIIVIWIIIGFEFSVELKNNKCKEIWTFFTSIRIIAVDDVILKVLFTAKGYF